MIVSLVRSHARRGARGGFTLVEAMIAISMTLIIMLALAQGFKRLSDDISKGRAKLALSDQLRGVSEILRNDLAGLTVDGDPTSKTVKSGYFLYYEGPIADHHPVTVPINNLPGGTTEQQLSTSKYGDFDDIWMFTARANGDWFRGRVPLAIVKGAATGGAGYTPTLDDWNNTVIVASEYAEIAYFMMPALDASLPSVINADGSPNILDNDSAVNPANRTSAGIDLLPNPPPNGGNGNAIPDSFTLCRRVLLILPNLNITYPTLSAPLADLSGLSGLYFDPSSFGSINDEMLLAASVNSNYLTSTRNAFQRCDLSLRRIRCNGALASYRPMAANSLEDLADPMNRFAHMTLPNSYLGSASTGADDRSMPLLALTGPIPLQRYASVSSYYGLDLIPRPTVYPECGFMHPDFLRRDYTADPSGAPSNAEVIATNCIAFDLRGMDTTARMLYHVGSDGLAGVALVDDDNNGTVDDFSELGWSGSDDLVVSPGDPGYSAAAAVVPTSGIDNVTASQGTFVDLGWAYKIPNPSATINNAGVVQTVLSGLQSSPIATMNNARIDRVTMSLKRSGRVSWHGPLGAPTIIAFQPSFDTYTDKHEHDGFDQQTTLMGTAPNISVLGSVFRDANEYLRNNISPSSAAADVASNGLDDDSNTLIDDYSEQDSSPPILAAMPAIQALIRLEDISASVIQQVSVTHDLVNQ